MDATNAASLEKLRSTSVCTLRVPIGQPNPGAGSPCDPLRHPQCSTAIVTPDDRNSTPFRSVTTRRRRKPGNPVDLSTEVLGPSTNPGASRQKARRGSEYELEQLTVSTKSRRRRSAPVECAPDAWRRQRRRVAEAGENEQRQQ
ncbi:hypothetical protein quinque_015589 [Culex quinquefasciatus]